MTFKEIVPGRQLVSGTRRKVRVSYPYLSRAQKDRGHNLNLYIGMEIANKIGLKSGDKVKFFIDSDNPRLWLIKKSYDNSGYKVVEAPKRDGRPGEYLRLQITWKYFKPKLEEIPANTATFDVHEGGLRIFPPK